MVMEFYLKFFLVFAFLYNSPAATGSSIGSEVKEKCGSSSFFCPLDNGCHLRAKRCNNSNVCTYSNQTELNCFAVSGTQFIAQRGYVTLFTRKRRATYHLKPYHAFVTYRGFVYEFGNYPPRELDYNDPDYYHKKRTKYKLSVCNVTSSCSREEVWKFMGEWKNKYNLIKHNCQNFAHELMNYLANNCETKDQKIAKKECLKVHPCPYNTTAATNVIASGSKVQPYELLSTAVTCVIVTIFGVINLLNTQ